MCLVLPPQFGTGHAAKIRNWGGKGAQIRATKIVQLVRQHCCRTSCLSMLLVLPCPSFVFLLRDQFETGVVKRATSTYNSFGNNVAERVVRFCCSYYRALRQVARMNFAVKPVAHESYLLTANHSCNLPYAKPLVVEKVILIFSLMSSG